MEKRLKIVAQGGTGELVEKKSRFISAVEQVKTQREALDFIAARKKQYWDARHNCYAYIIGKKSEIVRYSDDGEPMQTAGLPMLEVLQSYQLFNVVAVVTRYFGGVLLGTGGLVRAYQGALKAGLQECRLAELHMGHRLKISTGYNYYDKLSRLFRKYQVFGEEAVFTSGVVVNVTVEQELTDALVKEVLECTGGGARVEKSDLLEFFIEENEKNT